MIERVQSSDVGRDETVVEALRLAVEQALLTHERAGNPVAVWRNNRVAWVSAKEAREAVSK